MNEIFLNLLKSLSKSNENNYYSPWLEVESTLKVVAFISEFLEFLQLY